MELLEKLSELEHEQWIDWSKSISQTETISQDRLDRWSKSWCSYSELSEEEKEQDRIYARKILNVIDEKKSEDIVKINIPTITRLFEYMMEDVSGDIELHEILERLIKVSNKKQIIKMSDYDKIIGKNKMELKEEITNLEKQMEAIDKTKNPIEKNPENKRNKGTTTKMDNVPEDKENDDKIKDKKDKYIKYESLQSELSGTIKEFNEIPTMKEAKIFIDDPFEAPPGANVQVGPRGGYFYDTSEKPKSGDKKKKDVTKDMSSDKNLSKAK